MQLIISGTNSKLLFDNAVDQILKKHDLIPGDDATISVSSYAKLVETYSVIVAKVALQSIVSMCFSFVFL